MKEKNTKDIYLETQHHQVESNINNKRHGENEINNSETKNINTPPYAFLEDNTFLLSTALHYKESQ